jgi:hypothetical protein
MRKAVIDRNAPIKEASGRRYWVRAALPAPPPEPDPEPEETVRRPQKGRFLEPFHLAEERRAELVKLLGAARVGDTEGRVLFAAALEYDIANYRQSAPPPVAVPVAVPAPEPAPEPVAAEPLAEPQAALGESARTLAGTIAALDPAVRARIAAVLGEQDPFGRSYCGAYMEALCTELLRFAEAALTPPPPPPAAKPAPPPEPPPEPPLGEAAGRFLRRVARVYEETLESRVSLEPHSPFLAVLGLIAPEAGIPLPRDPADLAGVLAAR